MRKTKNIEILVLNVIFSNLHAFICACVRPALADESQTKVRNAQSA